MDEINMVSYFHVNSLYVLLSMQMIKTTPTIFKHNNLTNKLW